MPSHYLLNTLTSGLAVTAQQSVSLAAVSVRAPKVQSVLDRWEIPEECVLEGLEFWQTGTAPFVKAC